MVVALGDGEGLWRASDVDEQPPRLERSGPEAASGRRPVERVEPSSERIVHELLQRNPPGRSQLVQACRHVIIEAEGGSHASKHMTSDAVMP